MAHDREEVCVMGKTMKTSVIVPVYNTEIYLRDCFESIFRQTQKELEVIAINDGSTDGSLSELERIKTKHPELIIVNQNNRGLSCARNIGMKLARGKYVYFCDSDDILRDNNALEECYLYAEKNDIDVVMFDAEVFGDARYNKGNAYDRINIINRQYEPIRGKDYITEYFEKCFLSSACLLYLKIDFLKENDIHFIEGAYYEDNLFQCEVMLFASKVLYIPKVYYGRRYRVNSIMTSTFDKKHFQDRLMIAEAIEALVCQDEIKAIFHKRAMKMIKLALDEGLQNNLFEDRDNARQIYMTAKDVCEVGSLKDMDFLYQISLLIYREEEQYAKQMRDENLMRIFKQLDFKNSDIHVGIYGIGKYAQYFLDKYEELCGKVNSELLYIETNPQKAYFRGKKVVSIDDIAHIDLDYILIASSEYEQQIEQNIIRKYGNVFKIIKLKDELHFQRCI